MVKQFVSSMLLEYALPLVLPLEIVSPRVFNEFFGLHPHFDLMVPNLQGAVNVGNSKRGKFFHKLYSPIRTE